MTNFARLIELTERLIAYPTVTGDKKAALDCLMYCERALTLAGMHINRYTCNGFESLVATTHDTMKPKIFLVAHLDVVPGAAPLFKLRRSDGKLMGRGVFDMKYAAACYLKLVGDLHEEIGSYDFGVMLTTDEEDGGQNGVRYLLEQGYSCGVALIPDGGDNWRLESAAKGDWTVRATATGKTAHSSRPWEGINASTKLIDFLQTVQQTFVAASHTDTTVVISIIKAGEAHNQVPETAEAVIDVRFLQQAAYKTTRHQLEALAKEYGIALSTDNFIPSIQQQVSAPLVQTWEEGVSKVRGNASDGYALSFGSSDARYFVEKNIPAIVTRPDGGGHHSSDEWLLESGLYEFYDCVKTYIARLARTDAGS